MASEKLPWKYDESLPNQPGQHLTVSEHPLHKIYYEEHGNPKGEAVFVFHGGPGYGFSNRLPRFFDPKHYRIIIFDQRGAGRSQPYASLENNTTEHLVGDIDKLRDHLGIKGKMHLFGGSWGSTLALCYAVAHPEKVKSMTLRGIFLCRQADIAYMYQGNAADPDNKLLMGAGRFFPEDWKNYVELVPHEKRRDMLEAYHEMLHSNEMITVGGKLIKLSVEAAKRWCRWESAISLLIRDEKKVAEYVDAPETAEAAAKIENHYFRNGTFLNGTDRNQNYIIENIDRIKNIPTEIVQGRYDMVCPRDQADDLVAAWNRVQPNESKRPKLHIIDNAGHSYTDPANLIKLTEITERFKKLGQNIQRA